MKQLRKAAVVVIAALIACPSGSSAASLYSGLKTARPRSGSALAAPSRIPAAPASLSPDSSALSADQAPSAPQSPAAAPAGPFVSAPRAKTASSAAAKAAPAVGAGAKPAAQALEQAAQAVAGAANQDAQAQAVPLDAAFDGLTTQAGRSDGEPPSPQSVGSDSFDNFVALAKGLFHPTLPAGREPSVAAAMPVQVRPDGEIPSDADMQARMALSPLTNPEREAAVIKLYQAGGAAAQVVDVERGRAPNLELFDAIQSQDTGRNRHNLIVVKKGSGDRIVVVGAHHDKVSEGAGTIDNWTGSTMLTNLYQAMKGVETESTFVFVAFAREEEGLVGSDEFLRSLSKTQRARIDSMINLDTLAVDGTFSWKNNSTRSLLDLIKRVAAREQRDLVEATLHGGDADSSTFRRAGIAAMTIYGASEEIIFDIIHSARDTMAVFSLPHYRNAYLLTLALLKTLDREPVKKPAAA